MYTLSAEEATAGLVSVPIVVIAMVSSKTETPEIISRVLPALTVITWLWLYLPSGPCS